MTLETKLALALKAARFTVVGKSQPYTLRAIDSCIHHIADVLEIENERFNREEFYQEAGLGDMDFFRKKA